MVVLLEGLEIEAAASIESEWAIEVDNVDCESETVALVASQDDWADESVVMSQDVAATMAGTDVQNFIACARRACNLGRVMSKGGVASGYQRIN